MIFNADALRAIVKSGGVPFRENATSFVFDCPSCKKSARLYVRKSNGRCICFACGKDSGLDGRCEKAMIALYGYDWRHWSQVLRDYVAPMGYLDFTLNDPWATDDDLVSGDEREFFGLEWPPDAIPCWEPGGERGMAYLVKRGLSPELIQEIGCRYIPRENRVCFPFVIDGVLVGWQRRLCGPEKVYDPVTGLTRKQPKVLSETEPGVQGNYVMFGDGIEAAGHAIITEGPISALKCHLCRGYVATLGKGMVSEHQVAWIAKRVRKVYVGFDPDAGASITRLTLQFAAYDIPVYLLMPPGNGQWAEDLGDCTPEQVLEQFRVAPQICGNNIMASFGGVLAF